MHIHKRRYLVSHQNVRKPVQFELAYAFAQGQQSIMSLKTKRLNEGWEITVPLKILDTLVQRVT